MLKNHKTIVSLVMLCSLSTAAFSKVPDVLAFEKILKAPEKPLMAPPKLEPLPPLPNGNGFNVIGVMSVNGKVSAWLLNQNNKVIHAAQGVRVDGKTITGINIYGVSYTDSTGGGFLPVMNEMTDEKNIVFNTREKVSENNSQPVMK